MKKIVFLIVLAIGIVACNSKKENESVEVINLVTQDTLNPEIGYNNPTVFVGSDFGNFINVLYKQGQYDEMVKWTYSKSIQKLGKEQITDFYKNKIRFGFELGKVKSRTVQGDTIILNYEAKIIATKKIIRISVIVENDSCKLILDNLDKFPG